MFQWRLIQLSAVVGAAFVILAVPMWLPGPALAAQTESICVLDQALQTASAEHLDPLAGRLGGTREAFEARFGSPVDETLFIEYAAAGCAAVYADYHEGVLTDVSIYFPGFEDDQSEWTLTQAIQVAERFLPLDVQMATPYRNVTFVEHHECFSQALAERVPAAVYQYVDSNPTVGQCSAVYSLDLDGDNVQSLSVQLQIEDPN